MGAALPMTVAILLRGQSNANLFQAYGAAEQMRNEVRRDLGFDGRNGRVVLLGDQNVTMWGGVPFVYDRPDRPGYGPWLTGDPGPHWGIGTRERIFLDYLAKLPPELRHAPVLTVWMHNETDGYDFALTAQHWAQAVRYDAGLVRRILGPAPYLFVWVPANFPPENAAPLAALRTAQAIKQGMAGLAADAAFAAALGPQTGDLDMSGHDPAQGSAGNGGLHFSQEDAAILVHRIANCAANALAAYAKPGAPGFGGHLDCTGPVALRAWQDARQADVVHLRLTAPSGLAQLSPAAASGAGWRAVTPSYPSGVPAVAVTAEAPDTLALQFGQKLPPAARIYYGLGPGRIALGAGSGHGAAVYDREGMALTISPDGLPVSRRAD
jgi:hypothetical protein